MNVASTQAIRKTPTLLRKSNLLFKNREANVPRGLRNSGDGMVLKNMVITNILRSGSSLLCVLHFHSFFNTEVHTDIQIIWWTCGPCCIDVLSKTDLMQSILILPQIIKNVEKQSTKGLSHMLVILNLSGDVFKLTYFLVNVT